MSKRFFSVFLFFFLSFVLYSNEIIDENFQEDFQTTHTTSARLNVRSGPSTASPLLTTLEAGTAVQVLETGPQAYIGGTIAPWVRVVTRDGYTGWCFSGFLVTAAAMPAGVPLELAPGVVPLPLAGPGVLPPVQELAIHAVLPLPEAESGTGLPWLWLLLAGGVLVGAAVLAAVLSRREAG